MDTKDLDRFGKCHSMDAFLFDWLKLAWGGLHFCPKRFRSTTWITTHNLSYDTLESLSEVTCLALYEDFGLRWLWDNDGALNRAFHEHGEELSPETCSAAKTKILDIIKAREEGKSKEPPKTKKNKKKRVLSPPLDSLEDYMDNFKYLEDEPGEDQKPAANLESITVEAFVNDLKQKLPNKPVIKDRQTTAILLTYMILHCMSKTDDFVLGRVVWVNEPISSTSGGSATASK